MTMDESELGFGTDYEKAILTEILSNMAIKYGLDTTFNFPKNDLLGDTKDVTKSLTENSEHPDLLWNFCEFENEREIGVFFNFIESFHPEYVLIITQNWLNPGVILHYLYHKILGKRWDHGYIMKMTTEPVEEYVRTNGRYKVLEKGLFDAPWFILDVYESGKFLKKLLPRTKQLPGPTQKSIFEYSTVRFRKWASHHNYVLLKKCVDTKLIEA